jgi:hypothetical protein
LSITFIHLFQAVAKRGTKEASIRTAMTASLKKSSTFSIEEGSYEDISPKQGALKRWLTGLWPFAKIKQLRHVKDHLENDQRRVVFRPEVSDLEAGVTAIQRAPSTGTIRGT